MVKGQNNEPGNVRKCENPKKGSKRGVKLMEIVPKNITNFDKYFLKILLQLKVVTPACTVEKVGKDYVFKQAYSG